jgi:hypothetical protein
MARKLTRSLAMLVLVAGPGCTSVQAAGPYVRDISLDSDGRVSSFERCTLVLHYTGDVLQVEGEDCLVVRPGRAPPVQPGPVPASPAKPSS